MPDVDKNDEGAQMPDVDKAFNTDMQGIYAQHAQMCSIFNDSIRLLVTVSALPLVAAGLLIQATKVPDFANIPSVLVWTLLFTPLVVFLIVGITMENRFVILFYARALNQYRAIYSQWAADAKQNIDLSPMPTNSKFPANYEPGAQMGLVVHGSAAINGLYLVLGVYNLGGTVLAFLSLLAYLGLMEWWYWFSSYKASGGKNSWQTLMSLIWRT